MTNRERLIMAWEIFRDSNPYEICDGREFRAIKEPEYCMGQMIEDTLELLKEQEPKPGKWILDDEDANSWECSECGGLLLINDGTPLENDWYFCPYCGSKLEEQAVKWK